MILEQDYTGQVGIVQANKGDRSKGDKRKKEQHKRLEVLGVFRKLQDMPF